MTPNQDFISCFTSLCISAVCSTFCFLLSTSVANVYIFLNDLRDAIGVSIPVDYSIQ